MGIKLAISGKGGVGKSTLAGALARLLAAEGREVLAIDADPDANLASAIGLPRESLSSIKTIARERELIQERTGAIPEQYGQIFSLNPDVSGIAENYGTKHEGVNLVVLGAVQRAGGGCACPENVLLKALVTDLVIRRDEVVILDMEAGIEHLGRGTAMGVDLMLVVVEPGQRSIDTATRVKEMASGIGIRNYAVVINKSIDPDEDREWIAEAIGEDIVIGLIPFDPRIARAERKSQSVVDIGDEDIIAPFKSIKELIIERYEKK